MLAHYSSLVEIIINLYSVVFSMEMIGFEFELKILMAILASINVVISHSGCKCLTSQDHDNHHKYRNCNYSLTMIYDKMLGTYRQ
jgi:sterol desaturase/sphingolipid hydroxylase (fatty acid hydroxylase superfamily)